MATLSLKGRVVLPVLGAIPARTPRQPAPGRLSATPPLPTPPVPVQPQPLCPVATARTLEVLERIGRYIPDWIRVFPAREGDLIKPLPIGVEIALASLLPPGDEAAGADLRRTLRRYKRSN